MRRALACGLGLVALASGCGGADGETTAEAPAQTQTTTQAAEAAPSDQRAKTIAPKRRRLEDAGFEVKDTSAAGVPALDSAVDVPLAGGAQLTILVFKTERAAREKAKEFAPLADEAPGQVRLKVVGSTVYFAIAEEPGTTLDKGEFDRAVAAAEA